MHVWYETHHSQSPPSDFAIAISAAKKKLAGLAAPEISPTAPPIPPSITGPIPGINLSDFDGDSVDFQSGLAMLKMDLAIQSDLYQKAYATYLLTQDDGELRKRQLAFQDASAAYQKAEKDKARILADAGKTASLDAIASVLRDVLGPIPKMIRHQLRACFDELPTPAMRARFSNLPALLTDREQWRAFCDSFVDHVCEAMHETRLSTLPAEIAKTSSAAA